MKLLPGVYYKINDKVKVTMISVVSMYRNTLLWCVTNIYYIHDYTTLSLSRQNDKADKVTRLYVLKVCQSEMTKLTKCVFWKFKNFITFYNSRLSKLSKLSKRCCFTPYKSFENVLRMKKILLILVSLVMLATPIQAGVIDINPIGFPLLDTTIIDCRSCQCAYEHSHIPSAVWCIDATMVQLNDDDCIVYGDVDTCTNFCDNLSLIYPNITIFKLLDYDSLLEAPANTTFDNKTNLGLGIIVAIAGISFLVLIAIMEIKGRKGE